jgi:hypothetical protein
MLETNWPDSSSLMRTVASIVEKPRNQVNVSSGGLELEMENEKIGAN